MTEQFSGDSIAFARECGEQLVLRLHGVQSDDEQWSDDSRAAAGVARAMDDCLDRLSSTGLWGKENEVASNAFWDACGELLQCGDLQNQARTKPRRMAGDFEMLERICTGYKCQHDLGRYFDNYFQQQAAPQAVRNRVELLASAIINLVAAQGRCHLVSIGSGPASEVRQALQNLPEPQRDKVTATLIDIDEEALNFAAESIRTAAPQTQVETYRTNLQRYDRCKDRHEQLAPANLIYCLGLFDYLEDEGFEALLAALWNGATQGARIMAFNFSANNPSRAFMEWVGAWRLIYRTPASLYYRAAAAGIPPGASSVCAEPSGVNLYLDAVKTN